MSSHISAHGQRNNQPEEPQSNHEHCSDDRDSIDRVRDHFGLGDGEEG
jgi:hypothetical protein